MSQISPAPAELQTEEKLSLARLKRYGNLARPQFRLTLVFLFAVGLVGVAGYFYPPLQSQLGIPTDWRQGLPRIVFLLFTVLFASTWWFYFRTRGTVDKGFFAVQSLRRLLNMTSENWRPDLRHDKKLELDRGYTERAKGSSASIAVLIAVCTLQIVEFLRLLSAESELSGWDNFVVVAGLGLSLLSFACLLFSSDSIDTIFNSFLNEDLNIELDHFFYARVTTMKYIGFGAISLAMVFVIAAHHLPLACVFYALLFAIVYRHLFPALNRSGNPNTTPPIFRTLLILATTALVFIVAKP
ncbi:MAG: hypothetical protein AAF585_14335 [Verrucomicrobiota bacterium]